MPLRDELATAATALRKAELTAIQNRIDGQHLQQQTVQGTVQTGDTLDSMWRSLFRSIALEASSTGRDVTKIRIQ